MVKIKEFSGYKFNKQIQITLVILFFIVICILFFEPKKSGLFNEELIKHLDSCVNVDYPDGYKEISYISHDYYDSVEYYIDLSRYYIRIMENDSTLYDSACMHYENFKRLSTKYYDFNESIQYNTQPILIRFSIDVMVIENDNDTVYKKYSIK